MGISLLTRKVSTERMTEIMGKAMIKDTTKAMKKDMPRGTIRAMRKEVAKAAKIEGKMARTVKMAKTVRMERIKNVKEFLPKSMQTPAVLVQRLRTRPRKQGAMTKARARVTEGKKVMVRAKMRKAKARAKV